MNNFDETNSTLELSKKNEESIITLQEKFENLESGQQDIERRYNKLLPEKYREEIEERVVERRTNRSLCKTLLYLKASPMIIRTKHGNRQRKSQGQPAELF